MSDKQGKSAKLERGAYRANVTKLGKIVAGWFRDRHDQLPDYDELQASLEKLARYKEKIQSLNQIIVNETDDPDLEAEMGTIADYSEQILDSESNVVAMIKNYDKQAADAANSSVHSAASDNHSSYADKRLPKLDLVKFDGKPLEWQEFWDCFENAVHSNDKIPNFDKLRYLKNLLSGEAKSLVEGFRSTAVNYPSVVSVLKERFGSDQVVINAHLESLLALPMASMQTDSLRRTYDETERHLRSLEALGLQTDTFGVVFVPIIISKLPESIRVELHRRNNNKPWEIEKLREILKVEVVARVMGTWRLNDTGSANRGSSGRTGEGERSFTPGNRSAPKPVGTTQSLANPAKPLWPCPFCKDMHFAAECTKVPTLSERKQKLLNGCHKCLSSYHATNNCRKADRTCYFCRRTDHHRALCPDEFGGNKAARGRTQQQHGTAALNPEAPAFDPSTAGGVLSPQGISTAAPTSNFVHMQTAYVEFPGSQLKARVFFDSGSSRSYVSAGTARKLGLKSVGEEVLSNGRFEERQRRTKTYKVVETQLPCQDGSSQLITLLTTDTICSSLHRVPIDRKKYPLLSKIPLADPPPPIEQDVAIDILIGQDFYYQFVGTERYQIDSNLFLLGSKFGYIVAGTAGSDGDHWDTTLVATMYIDSQECCVQRFWELEDVGVRDDSYAKDDELALKQFNESVKYVNGHYEVGWPWKEGVPALPDNREVAMRRLCSLTKRLQKKENEGVLRVYDSTIKDQLKSGIIEEVTNDPTNNPIHYLPHHAVVKPDRATTKVRVVFDASSKAHKSLVSLNECLLRGPVYLADLCGLFLRFRTYRIAINADIEKAFHQVILRPRDRDVTRFFWLKNMLSPVSADNLVVYRFCSVLFGAISSSFLLNAVIQHHLLTVDSPVARLVENNIYVDNVVVGVEGDSDGLKLYSEVKQTFTEGLGMNIREWQSNSKPLMAQIPEVDHGIKECPKVLGMKWNPQTDTIYCSDPKICGAHVKTKRNLVQLAARLFDPCGLFSPVLVRAKLLVQETWKQKLKWDEDLPEHMQSSWQVVANDLQDVPSHEIPRLITTSTDTGYELHCFCDASKDAYAAAVYLRTKTNYAKPELMMSKVRLAPIRKLTICRLELLALVIGVRLTKLVREQLGLSIGGVTVWSDSKCVLQWLKSNKVLTTFVRNRIREVHGHEGNRYRYVPTKLNPADLPSRGCSYQDIANNGQWWHGPSFLQSPEHCWPTTTGLDDCDCDDNAEPATNIVSLPVVPLTPMGINPYNYSSLQRLVRVTALVQRFLDIVRRRVADSKTHAVGKSRKITRAARADPVNPTEYQKALALWLRCAQEQLSILPGSDGYSAVTNLKQQLGVFVDGEVCCAVRGD